MNFPKDDESKIRWLSFAMLLVAIAIMIADCFGFISHAHGAGVPTLVPVVLTHHDASGRTQQAVGVLNALNYSGDVVKLDYTSDQLYCSAFGGQ